MRMTAINYTGRSTLVGMVGLAGLVLTSTVALAQESAETGRTVDLMAADRSGVPESIAPGEWSQASGEATVTASENGEATIEVTAENLVSEGVYTIWWVTLQTIGMDMGPGGGTPGNEFTADAQGNASTTITVPQDNTYEMMVVAYHADGQTHGEEPGEMGEVTFEHLMGSWPGPVGKMDDM
ncbi:hypothetical protein [uncultured Jannaschia sp.]|uniref:hypothetical protein n=1 Tax=uncultured Jannaschia sp. TaxID=293347 RepID=UPI0026116305|nr:hypothetical protein [uncultured Jannaschia sp.]